MTLIQPLLLLKKINQCAIYLFLPFYFQPTYAVMIEVGFLERTLSWVILFNFWASLVAQRLKCLPTMLETRVRSLGREDPLEKEMATHSSILAWRIPWTENPGGLQSMGLQRVGHDWVTSLTYLLTVYLYSKEHCILEILPCLGVPTHCFWLRWVLVAALKSFVATCGIIIVAAHEV